MGLDGKGPLPDAYYISRICEEFQCRPSEAEQEWASAPAGWLEEVMEARAYAATKSAYDASQDAEHRPKGPMADLVSKITFALVEEEIAKAQEHG